MEEEINQLKLGYYKGIHQEQVFCEYDDYEINACLSSAESDYDKIENKNDEYAILVRGWIDDILYMLEK
jgi:hypothetical protein